MLLSNLDLFATAPGGVARLRELILALAVQGKLLPQDPADESASALLQVIRTEKNRLISEGKIRQGKPLAEIAEDEKPFELPFGWEWVRLGALSELITSGSRDWAEHYSDSGPIFVRMGNLSKGSYRLRMDQVQRVRPPKNGEGSRTSLEADDLLLSITGDVGMLGLIPPDFGEAYINQHTCLIRWVSCIRTEFLPIQLLSRFVQTQFNSPQRGIKNSFRLTDVSGILLAVPPLAEQSRIVARVEELMRLCDTLEAKGQLEATHHAQLVSTMLGTLTASTTPEELADNWQRVAQHFDLLLDRPEAIDALEQTLLQLAVRGLLVPQDPVDEPASELLKEIRAEKDGLIVAGQIKRDKPLSPITEEEKLFELPVGWEWVRVGDVVEMLNGYAFKSEWFRQAGVRLLRNLNVSHGHVDWSAPAMIDVITARDYEQFALRAGDIVLSLDRPIISTGLKYAVIRESDLPCLLLQRVARLTSWTCGVSSDFLVLWLQSDLFVDTIDPGRSNGVPHISTKQVAQLAFALPPVAEQSRIVARVTALRRLCVDLRNRLTDAQTTQSRLAQALVDSCSSLEE